jgi:catechol 2,3-dioxygenase-like lactoylglutathione lyase family enzyme
MPGIVACGPQAVQFLAVHRPNQPLTGPVLVHRPPSPDSTLAVALAKIGGMASSGERATEMPAGPISGLVPMVHVADVERSATFYRLLGFEIGNRVPGSGPMHWAWLYAPAAANWKRGPNLMLTRSDRAIDAAAQDVLFYLYAADLPALRNSLLSNGIDAGEIAYPDYLPNGEFRVRDPDGYTLMVAQSAADTP